MAYGETLIKTIELIQKKDLKVGGWMRENEKQEKSVELYNTSKNKRHWIENI